MLDVAILSAIKEVAGEHSTRASEIVSVKPVGGGCINQTYSVKTKASHFFVKINSASRYPGMFEAEARGLGLLAAAGELAVPKVFGSGSADGNLFLVLEFIESRTQSNDFWKNFGRGLARLHKFNGNKYGLDHNNYIGSLGQSNNQMEVWEDFFVSQRLLPQIKLAKQNGLMPRSIENMFSNLFNHLGDFFPPQKPSLIHGDLWAGNFMTNSTGYAILIDPAVYYGHRYMDLGMTKLFGGFSEQFYFFYNEEFPLEKEWQKGLDIANLYPLMVHVNLFGASYLSGVSQTLKMFT
jgi:protein-ribulosamine 3-kinase